MGGVKSHPCNISVMMFPWILQVLSLCSAVCASAYFGVLADLCSYMTKLHAAHPNVVIGTCYTFSYRVVKDNRDIEESLSFDSKSSVGWILALSFVTFIYQILAILQLFLDFEVPHIKKVLCKCTCTIFFLTVRSSLLTFESIILIAKYGTTLQQIIWANQKWCYSFLWMVTHYRSAHHITSPYKVIIFYCYIIACRYYVCLRHCVCIRCWTYTSHYSGPQLKLY